MSEDDFADFVKKRGAIQELDPELHLKAIEGYVDELAPEQRVEDALVRHQVCPHCGGDNLHQQVVAGSTWAPGHLLARAMLTCNDCTCTFNPHNGMILQPGRVVFTRDELEELKKL